VPIASPLRSPRERLLQTLAFELGGIAFVAPLYAAVFAVGTTDGILVIATVSAAVMIWTPLHNTLFDHEWRALGRVASDRPHTLRIVHAVSHELTAVAISLPLIMSLGGHGLWQALAINAGLTAIYVAYAYVFHLGYDRLRPVGQAPAAQPVRLRRGTLALAPSARASISS